MWLKKHNLTSENPITEPFIFYLKLIGLDEITAECEIQNAFDSSTDSLISDSIGQPDFLSDSMTTEIEEKKMTIQKYILQQQIHQ